MANERRRVSSMQNLAANERRCVSQVLQTVKANKRCRMSEVLRTPSERLCNAVTVHGVSVVQ
jgi:hypothetical protein